MLWNKKMLFVGSKLSAGFHKQSNATQPNNSTYAMQRKSWNHLTTLALRCVVETGLNRPGLKEMTDKEGWNREGLKPLYIGYNAVVVRNYFSAFQSSRYFLTIKTRSYISEWHLNVVQSVATAWSVLVSHWAVAVTWQLSQSVSNDVQGAGRRPRPVHPACRSSPPETSPTYSLEPATSCSVQVPGRAGVSTVINVWSRHHDRYVLSHWSQALSRSALGISVIISYLNWKYIQLYSPNSSNIKTTNNLFKHNKIEINSPIMFQIQHV